MEKHFVKYEKSEDDIKNGRDRFISGIIPENVCKICGSSEANNFCIRHVGIDLYENQSFNGGNKN